jgi:hypothetical protein
MDADWENSRFNIDEIKLGLMVRDSKKLGNYIFFTFPEIDKVIEEYHKAVKELKKKK